MARAKELYGVQAVLLNEVQLIESALNEHVSIAITDKSGRIKYVNEKFCATPKYSAEELLEEGHRIVNSGFHSKEFMRVLWDTLTAGKIWKKWFKNRTREGTFYWIDATIIPLRDRAESPYQYVALWIDVTGLSN
ncbi:PAS domain S-box-containing protein [Nitrosomonas sp. Nm84]|uniref:PAS domain-containing protein n=1 Tax=Nitrosomonas sp. Nm84 TaxID=200124 RepID=UPI000D76E53C|nr:PAS domain-containing protein [Nitrosomonas sp. Nm84]PXW85700.1 PAS domain S-box-containing protein [Nitrosomonas sp. Nm84]